MKIFFNSSLPRAGSSIFSNILGNNPDIYATPTSGLLEIFRSAKKVYTQSNIFKAQDEQEMKKAFLHFCAYGIHGYFEGLTDRKYVIDKSRGWIINYAFLNSFYSNPKIICCTRDLRDILASMESNFRKYPYKWDEPSDGEEKKADTVDKRVDFWLNTNPVGTTLKNLKEAIHRGYDKDVLFVRFEDLTKNPQVEMKRVYDYLDIPYFQHDFQKIKQVTFEDDKFHGRYGDHTIKSKLEPVPSKAKILLGEEICNRIYNENKWYFDKFNYPREL